MSRPRSTTSSPITTPARVVPPWVNGASLLRPADPDGHEQREPGVREPERAERLRLERRDHVGRGAVELEDDGLRVEVDAEGSEEGAQLLLVGGEGVGGHVVRGLTLEG